VAPGGVGQEGLTAGYGYGVHRHGGRRWLTLVRSPKNESPLEATVLAGTDGTHKHDAGCWLSPSRPPWRCGGQWARPPCPISEFLRDGSRFQTEGYGPRLKGTVIAGADGTRERDAGGGIHGPHPLLRRHARHRANAPDVML
jgi:hypothetical protein